MEQFFSTIIIFLIAYIPAIILFIVGYSIRSTKPKTTKILYILAVIYVIIGLGICGTLLMSLT